ncbi:uncharacterized protein [Elaeis guineensis]|uniref:uncharacterized protein n=1 Tax=Elaeis guineensis var. tenera TaxID=51953 RepID=UPI003C6D03D1
MCFLFRYYCFLYFLYLAPSSSIYISPLSAYSFPGRFQLRAPSLALVLLLFLPPSPTQRAAVVIMSEIQIGDFLDEDYRPLRKRPKKNNAPLQHPPSQATRKMKPSKFHAPTRLRIGAWEHVSRHEGDLEAKCYFARQKLIWEFLESGLKSKIEIPWSHIKGLKVTYPETGDGTLDIEIATPPLFYKETDPQPRKHTIWRPTTDFTGFQASIHRHFLECEQDSLRENMDKIFQCSPRLYFLSQQPEDESKSPYSTSILCFC